MAGDRWLKEAEGQIFNNYVDWYVHTWVLRCTGVAEPFSSSASCPPPPPPRSSLFGYRQRREIWTAAQPPFSDSFSFRRPSSEGPSVFFFGGCVQSKLMDVLFEVCKLQVHHCSPFEMAGSCSHQPIDCWQILYDTCVQGFTVQLPQWGCSLCHGMLMKATLLF